MNNIASSLEGEVEEVKNRFPFKTETSFSIPLIEFKFTPFNSTLSTNPLEETTTLPLLFILLPTAPLLAIVVV